MNDEIPSSGPRRCILVLGMHRSGTSALTRVLSLLGAALPRNILGAGAGNETGHWEPSRLVEYHDRLLAELGSSWDDWKALDLSRLTVKRRSEIKSEITNIIEAEYPEGGLFVVKDPRLCRFAPLFIEAMGDTGVTTHVVIPYRNPLEVANSLAARPTVWAADRLSVFGALLWLRHVLDAEAATRGLPRAFVSYDALLADWCDTAHRIVACIGVEWPYAPNDIADLVGEFLTPSQRHHTYTAQDLILDPAMRDWVGEAYQAIGVLLRDPEHLAALETLDRIHREFDHATPLLDRLLLDAGSAIAENRVQAAAGEAAFKLEVERERAAFESERLQMTARLSDQGALIAATELRLSEVTAREDALRAEVELLHSKLTNAEASAQASRSDVQFQKSKTAEAEARMAALDAELRLLRAELQQSEKLLQAQHQEMCAQVANAQTAAEDASNTVDFLQTELARVQGEVAHTRAQNESLKDWLAAYENSTSWKLTAPVRMAKTALQIRKPRNLHHHALSHEKLVDFDAADNRDFKVIRETEIDYQKPICLLVTYSPDGQIRPHVKPMCDAYRANGVQVFVIVATDEPNLKIDRNQFEDCELVLAVENGGYDFACWAFALKKYPSITRCNWIVFANDSVIGPGAGFGSLLNRVLSCDCDCVGLVESHQITKHCQSFWFAIRGSAFNKAVVRDFWNNTGTLPSKTDVINTYELNLWMYLESAGISWQVLFPLESRDFGAQINPTHQRWDGLLARSFPFVKCELVRDNPCRVDLTSLRPALDAAGISVDIVTKYLLDTNPKADALKYLSEKSRDAEIDAARRSPLVSIYPSGCKSALCYIVAGSARSGTSMVTGVLRLLGIDMGEDLDKDNNEDRNFITHDGNRELFTSRDDRSQDYLRNIESYIHLRQESHVKWGWKDPLSMYYIGDVYGIIQNPVIIVVTRDACASVQSEVSFLQLENSLTADLVYAQINQTLFEQKLLWDVVRDKGASVVAVSYERAVMSPTVFVDRLIEALDLDVSEIERRDAIGYIRYGTDTARITDPRVSSTAIPSAQDDVTDGAKQLRATPRIFWRFWRRFDSLR